MKKNFNMRYCFFVLLISFIAISCTPVGKDTISIRLKWLFFSNYSGAVVAKEKGFFPVNWSVEVRQGGFQANSITMVESGSDDFGITSALELLRARAQGIKIVALCADFQKSPVSFLTLASSNIKKIEDFPGHIIGIKYGTNTELLYKVLLKRAGVDQNSVTTIPMKFSTLPLVGKQVDVYPSYYMTDPVNLESQGIPVTTINPDEYGVECYGNILFTHENTIREKPYIVREFVAAYVRGWKWAIEHPEETGEIFANLNEATSAKNQVEILKRTQTFLLVEGTMDRFGAMEEKKWLSTLDISQEDPGFNTLPNAKTLNIRDCYTNDFLLTK
jgi:ABC-type nitrate/sulfonate/bicarbonate transport system substrate-binding protein